MIFFSGLNQTDDGQYFEQPAEFERNKCQTFSLKYSSLGEEHKMSLNFMSNNRIRDHVGDAKKTAYGKNCGAKAEFSIGEKQGHNYQL